nr:hypothetical protein Iba_chr05dCG19310 [Ipomoea batatas]
MGNPILFDWIFPCRHTSRSRGTTEMKQRTGVSLSVPVNSRKAGRTSRLRRNRSVNRLLRRRGSLRIVIRKRRLTFGTRFGSWFRLPLICVVVVSCESSVNFIGVRQYAKLVTTSSSDIIVLYGVSGVVHSSRRLCFLRDQYPSPILGSSLCRRSGRRWFRVTSILSYWSCFAVVEQTVPRTGLPNPKSNSPTGNRRPDETTSAAVGPSRPNTIFDSISPGLWHSIQSIKSKKCSAFVAVEIAA